VNARKEWKLWTIARPDGFIFGGFSRFNGLPVWSNPDVLLTCDDPLTSAAFLYLRRNGASLAAAQKSEPAAEWRPY
jgi:hypothetical protein